MTNEHPPKLAERLITRSSGAAHVSIRHAPVRAQALEARGPCSARVASRALERARDLGGQGLPGCLTSRQFLRHQVTHISGGASASCGRWGSGGRVGAWRGCSRPSATASRRHDLRGTPTLRACARRCLNQRPAAAVPGVCTVPVTRAHAHAASNTALVGACSHVHRSSGGAGPRPGVSRPRLCCAGQPSDRAVRSAAGRFD